MGLMLLEVPLCRRAVEGAENLAIACFRWHAPLMTVTADAKKRVVLPPAKPGDRFDVQLSDDGRLVLTPLIPKPEPRKVVVKLARHGDGLFLQIPKGYKLAPDAIEQAVAEERESRQ